MSIYSDARDAFIERFEDVIAGTEEIPAYWQDDISELADSLIPVYTFDRVREWLDAGCPDVDDAGLIEGVTDIVDIIAVALYEQYSQALYELASEHGFD